MGDLNDTSPIAQLARAGERIGLRRYAGESSQAFASRVAAALEQSGERRRDRFLVLAVRAGISLAFATIGITFF